MKIIAGMFAAGDGLYDEMAEISVPSFLRANINCDLAFFTDDFTAHQSLYKFRRLLMEPYRYSFDVMAEQAADFNRKIEHPRCDVDYGTHSHYALYLAMFPLILQRYAERNGYDWALMLDVDSYFVGNMVDRLIGEIQDICQHRHFFAVDQSHPAMACSDPIHGTPGAGFQLWQVKSCYIERYTLGFQVNCQTTFHNRLNDGKYLRHIVLIYPGYHFVYPFARNPNFNREDALHYNPAYFHLGVGQGGPAVMWQLEKFDEWFNPERR